MPTSSAAPINPASHNTVLAISSSCIKILFSSLSLAISSSKGWHLSCLSIVNYIDPDQDLDQDLDPDLDHAPDQDLDPDLDHAPGLKHIFFILCFILILQNFQYSFFGYKIPEHLKIARLYIFDQ